MLIFWNEPLSDRDYYNEPEACQGCGGCHHCQGDDSKGACICEIDALDEDNLQTWLDMEEGEVVK